MTDIPSVCVIVPLPTSATHVSDLLWSFLCQRSLSFEAIVLVDEIRDPTVAAAVRTTAAAEARVRMIGVDSALGRGAAIAVALAATRAPYVTVAEPDGMCVDGGYQALVEGLESSGSDLAVGSAEILGRSGRRLVRAVDGALDTDARSVSLADRTGLIADDVLCTKVLRRELLESAVDGTGAWSERATVARSLVAASGIDVHCRAVFGRRRSVPSDAAVQGSRAWLADLIVQRAVVASASARVRECSARTALVREILDVSAKAELTDDRVAAGLSDLVRALAADLTSTSLSNLSIAKRWQLALIALGRMELVDVVRQFPRRATAEITPPLHDDRLSGEAWVSLGLDGAGVHAAFVQHFVKGPRTAFGSDQPGDTDTDTDIEISVVIPTFNVASYVDELVNSIRSAVGVRLEIIIVDDASDDGTWDRLIAHQEADERVRVVRSLGRGGGQARNLGVEMARGEYLAFADGDDFIPPHAYAHMLEIARRSGADVVSGSYLKFFSTTTWDASTGYNGAYSMPLEGVTIAQHPQLARHRAVWNRLIRRERWLSSAAIFPGVPRSNDIVAMLSVLLDADTVAVTPRPVYVYRERPGNGSMTSASGTVDYTVSYLSEEAACAALVHQRASASVTSEYWAMVLTADAWGNILQYLDRRSGATEDDARVAEQVRLLLSRAPRGSVSAISVDRQLVWALVAAGLFDEARTILAELKSASNLPLPAVVAAIRAAADFELLPRAVVASLARKHLLRQLLDDSSARAKALSDVRPLLRRFLTDEVAPVPVVPGGVEERFARAIVDADVAEVQRVLSASVPRVNAEIRTGVRSASIGGAVDEGSLILARIVARKYRDPKRQRVPVCQVRVDGDLWSAPLDPSMLPRPGVWVLEIEHHDRWGIRRSPLRLRDARRQLIPRRLRRILIVGSRKGPSLIRLRDPLELRVRNKIMRLLRGRV